ncbi:hypothetical protein TNCT_459781 [Trichonephila clavata]|uniref:Uncharacterized protein n=1 Tax=Trichonephila clavata TaxID=2740835 RepID=A0A8X6L1Y8_TRICU|nr:hypothetical protein TNCT_459781 [Trichonephila clavata]
MRNVRGSNPRTSNSDAFFERTLTFSRYLDASRLEWRPLEKESSRDGGVAQGYLDASRLEWRPLEKESSRDGGVAQGRAFASHAKCPGFKSPHSNSDAFFERTLTFSRYLDASRLEWRPLEKESSRDGGVAQG